MAFLCLSLEDPSAWTAGLLLQQLLPDTLEKHDPSDTVLSWIC